MADGDLIVFATPGWRTAELPTSAELAMPTLMVDTADALRRLLARHAAIVLVVVDLAVADAELLDQLQRADAPRALFVLDGERWLDAVTLADNVVAYLADTVTTAELQAAILSALPTGLTEVRELSERDSARLNALGSEVERIARALNELANEAKVATRGQEVIAAPFVRQLIKQRRERERFFPAQLFSDPAWDMLLDLTAARLERRYVSVSSLCIAAAVPTTTALRWIRNLCELGLFVRDTDPDDARRALISLSDETAAHMLDYLASVRAGAVG